MPKRQNNEKMTKQSTNQGAKYTDIKSQCQNLYQEVQQGLHILNGSFVTRGYGYTR
jgi:hypothetical protein